MHFAIRLFVIAAIAVVAVVAALLPYVLHFYGPLSNKPDDWAAFGSYVGGVTAPVLAFASLVAVLYTVHAQWAEHRRSTHVTLRAAELQRLAGLITLHDHYQKHLLHQGDLAKQLSGTSGQSLAYDRIAELDQKLREVSAAIECFHATCLKSADA